METALAEAFRLLPDHLGQHVQVSATALALGLAISLPLAIFALRRPRLRTVLLGIAGVVQTIPGIALLALFFPLLLGIAALSGAWFGFEFSALGFLPSVLALALYSVLPILRNTIAGVEGIDPALIQAARGVGMTRWQSLRMVELPLAAPVIMAGIRTSTVWVIGTATLSTPVGQTSLGNYIFTGLQIQNWIFVLFGCFAAAILALAIDTMLGMMERGVAVRSRMRILIGAAGIALIVLAALGPGLMRAPAGYLIGAKPFAEQIILASLIEQRLKAEGENASRREGLGSTVAFSALAAGEIDAYVEYSGTIYTNYMKRTDTRPREETLAAVTEWLAKEHGIAVVGGLGFENAYALAMPRAQAEKLGIRTIADLAPHASNLTIAGDYEFFGRPEWNALRNTYSLRFSQARQMLSEFMYRAAGREADVIAAYTSDGRIQQYDLVVLEDPKNAIPPYDALVVVAPGRAKDERLLKALKPLIGAIDIEAMRAANLQANEGRSPAAAARWLWERIQNAK